MAARLSSQKREELFTAYMDKQSILYVANICSVSHTTARKYKYVDEWDNRLINVRKKAAKKTDDTLAGRLASQINAVRFTQSKILESIKNGVIATPSIGDLDRMIRLERLLLGEGDSDGNININIKINSEE